MSIKINGVDRESTLHQMSTDPFGSYVLANNPNIYEPQRTNDFELIITGVDGLLKAGTDGSSTSHYISNVQEVLRISLSQAFIPHFTLNTIEIKRGNNSVNFAGGISSWSGGDIRFNDWIGAETKEALMAWQNQAYDIRTEKVGLATDYKKECYIIEYTPDRQVVRTWALHGCFVYGISEDERSHDENSTACKITANIKYDWAEIVRSTDDTTNEK